MLDCAAANRLGAEIGNQEDARGWRELVRLGRDAGAWVESRLRTTVELLEVRAEALARVGMGWVGRPDLPGGDGQQLFHLAHRVDELFALVVVEPREHRRGEVVASLVEQRSLGDA